MTIKLSRSVAISAALIELATIDVVCEEVRKLMSEGYPVIQLTGIRFDAEEERHPEWEACKK